MTVCVVGAGITGLSLVHHLERRGREVVALEAADRPGGVVRSDRIDGRVVERGPHRIRRTDPVDELIEDLGLASSVIAADDSLPLYVYLDGRLRVVPRSLGEFLRTDLLSWRGKLRVLYEPLSDPARPDERVDELFRRKFGDECYENVVYPLFGGIYASDPAEMLVEHSLSPLLRLEEREGNLLRPALRRARSDTGAPPISFEEGLERLPAALYREHEDRVHLDAPVEAIRRARTGDGAPAADREDGERGDGHRYEVVTPDETIHADSVVVTTPAPAAADLLEPVAPAAADDLRQLNYNPIVMVYLHSDARPDGFGYQVHHDEGLRTRGVTFTPSLFDRDGVYTAFLGGMEDPGAIEESDEVLQETAVREFEAVLDAEAEPIDVHRLRAYPAHDTSWSAIDDLTVPDGIELATNYTARIGVPSRVREARRLAETLA
jgi:oxygen-dependent protoporphyrinogen oxidase